MVSASVWTAASSPADVSEDEEFPDTEAESSLPESAVGEGSAMPAAPHCLDVWMMSVSFGKCCLTALNFSNDGSVTCVVRRFSAASNSILHSAEEWSRCELYLTCMGSRHCLPEVSRQFPKESFWSSLKPNESAAVTRKERRLLLVTSAAAASGMCRGAS